MKYLLMAAVAAATLCQGAAAKDFETAPRDLKLNEIQVLGTHNSYARPVDKRLLAVVDPIIEKMMAQFSANMSDADMARFKEEHPNGMKLSEGLKYDHPDLKTQLDAGLRSLEIDVNPDPEGGHYLDPAGYRLLRAQGITDLPTHNTTDLDKPGFKVLHVPDIDFRSHCPTLKMCLTDLREWSDANPKHVPVFIMLEAKSQGIPILPDPTPAVPFDAARFDELDQEIINVLGRDRLLTPDDVRGNYATLNAAIRGGNWPKLSKARGKIIFLMITANGPGSTRVYLDGHPSLKGRVAFLRAEPGEDHSAFLMYDNALVRSEDIKRYVSEGYLVRTRSDIETYEAKTNDMARAKAAFESGAQVVSTDFFRPGNAYGTDYVVTLPGGGAARCNPLKCPTGQ
ncbi:phosphatidylinositol-specific phospholipase C1-like protein [Asticcacaulis sp. ZE23SCel15]|uniref:phosphatidylinositol-specific phospholipase C1-like protein n=1 Tax=Asticcacaulis sp. ZE23SCel15 TaxID=3059027 RepID=UPI00265E799B|nr:phosphatidylinositol-specific phospholipase C1-like protein [Asticcacaulis sp. ZE23SCel15]WKL58962.1 phosphatidylinositol-specific phospholipase C1-like protein [Asticcacaulis sp. ZE23SCel15]